MEYLPLMSIFMKNYNQLPYIDESLGSLLAQTYSPLEVVVCDDHSTDGSYERICEIVEAYKRKGGTHKVVVHRSERNLGIAPTTELAINLCHGELCFQCDGDDIQLPNRVERVAMAWIADGKKATLCWNGWWEMDSNERIVGCRNLWHESKYPPVSGGVMAYTHKPLQGFVPVENVGYFDDVVLGHRVMMAEDFKALVIDEPLLIYRLGGVSNAGLSGGVRKGRSAVLGAQQLAKDFAGKRNGVSEGKKAEIEGIISSLRQRGEMSLKKFGGVTVRERFDGFWHHPMGRGSLKTQVVWLVYVLLPRLGKILLAIDSWQSNLRLRFRYRHVTKDSIVASSARRGEA